VESKVRFPLPHTLDGNEILQNSLRYTNTPTGTKDRALHVFTAPAHPVALEDQMQWWSYVKNASRRHPEGPDSNIKGREKHPVVHVAYEDAEAYARWAGKRLPTEAEGEFAERGGLGRQPYAWGKEFKPAGRYMANTFQGHFPDHDTAADGYVGTAPVTSCPPNGYGLYDMSGNVWEWTSDWCRPDYY
jgi:sulfatase modifying factor 1